MKRLNRHFFHLLLIPFLFQVAQSASLDSLYTTIPDDEERLVEIAEAWEELSMSDNRVRCYLPEWRNQTFPGYNLKARLRSKHYSAGFLLQRDQGEDRLDDLSRFYFSVGQPQYDLIFGDYHVAPGLGWTVSTKFQWTNSYSFNNHSPFSGNLSNEEGQGFRGGLVNLRDLAQPGPFGLSVTSWLGFIPYDVYPENENVAVFFSLQGDHSRDYSRVEERVIGSTLNLSLKDYPASIGFIINKSDFSKPLSPIQPARFSYLTQHFTAYGINGRFGSEKQLAFETTAQENGANAFAVDFKSDISNTLLLLKIYRASEKFVSLHARPDLAFSGTASGKSGFLSSMAFLVDPELEINFTSRIEIAEPTSERMETRKFRNDLGCIYSSIGGYKFICRAISYLKWENNQATDDLRILRSNLEIPFSGNSLCLRLEAQTNNHKPGALISVKTSVRPFPSLGIQLTTTYLNEAGDEMSLMVVEPVGPGLFPIRMLSGRQLRQAFSVNIRSFQNVHFWCSGFVNHRMGEMSEKYSDEIRLGFEWYKPGIQHGR